MKRLLITGLCISMIFTMGGCGKKEERKETAKKPIVIGGTSTVQDDEEHPNVTMQEKEDKKNKAGSEKEEPKAEAPAKEEKTTRNYYYEFHQVLESKEKLYKTETCYFPAGGDTVGSAYIEIPEEYRDTCILYDPDGNHKEYDFTYEIDGVVYVFDINNTSDRAVELAPQKIDTDIKNRFAEDQQAETIEVRQVDHCTMIKFTYMDKDVKKYNYYILPTIDAQDPNDRFYPRGRFYFIPFRLTVEKDIPLSEFDEIASFVHIDLEDNYVELSEKEYIELFAK